MSETGKAIRSVARLFPRGVRNWLRSPTRSIETLYDAARARIAGPVAVPIRSDWSARLHPAAARAIVNGQLSDPLQVAELDSFASHCRPGMCLLDFGAHFGVFSLAAVHYGGEDAMAVAVEPSPYAGRVLLYNAEVNGAGGRMTWTRAAGSDRPGEFRMLDVGAIGHGYFVSADDEHPAKDLVAVPAITVDSLVAERSLAPTHIKVDVEGAELSVLKGAAETLAAHRPRVFLELHCAMIRERGESPSEVVEFLRASGYELRSCADEPLEDSTIAATELLRLVAIPV